MRYRAVFLILLVFVIAANIFYFSRSKQTSAIKIDGVYLTKPTDIADFQLTDNKGKIFTKTNLTGHWTFLFFGFTNCGMVCPTTMAALNNMHKILEKDLPQDQLPQVVLVSVDPERDTTQRINEYVKAFNPHFIGARGDMAATTALEKQLHIISVKMLADGQGKNHYTINHSAEIMLFNPSAKLQAFLSYPHQAEQMANDYKLIIGNAS